MTRELYYVVNNRHKYTWIKADSIEANGTSLQGYIRTTYNKLRTRFKESAYDVDKSRSQWTIKVDGNIIITVYDFISFSEPDELYDWHVGGKDKSVVDIIKEIHNG